MAGADTFRLVIGGSPAVGFAGRCKLVVGESKEVSRDIAGRIPSSGSIEADAVECRIRKQDQMGRLTVKLQRGGATVASASTAAAYGAVKVRSDGSWGRARGLNVR